MGDLNTMAHCLLKEQLRQRSRRMQIRLAQGVLAVVVGLTLGLYNGIGKTVGSVGDDFCTNGACVYIELKLN